MKNPLRKIIAAFFLIAMIPVCFIVYELSSLNKNEKIVKEIYQNQLDAILYSVNQYSDDIISSWANRIGLALSNTTFVQKKDSTSEAQLLTTLSQLNAIEYLYLSDLDTNSKLYSHRGSENENGHVQKSVDKLVKINKGRIEKLTGYLKAGFRKMEAMDTTLGNDLVPIFFIVEESSNKTSLGVMLIDLTKFVGSVLGPKMQTISQEQFIISAYSEKNDSLIYTTESITPGSELRVPTVSNGQDETSQKKQFWLLPGYYLQISLKGATLNDLVKERITTSLIILVILILVLASGIIFLYRNIRREIYLSQAKSEFVSNVSHEIRTPLSLISMYAETLELDRIPEEKKKEYYHVISKETARLSGIVNRILNFSQLEANRKSYETNPVQLNELCREIYESYLIQLEEKGFSFNFTGDESLGVFYGDRESIREAVINLVDNAVKYSRDKKNITIKTGIEGRYTFVEVRDEGIGIAKNHQPEIFDKFYRAPIGDVHTTKGSGLGLTLVQKTMEAHSGKIKVESAPGKGSAFRLYFPLKKMK